MENQKIKHAEFKVSHFNGAYLDTVFFSSDMTSDEVKQALISHDGYSETIFVQRVPE